MCRWIAYSGKKIPLEHYVTEPQHSLVTQSIRALQSMSSTNGDGFGLGWYGEHAEPGLYREIRPAWSDENLRYLCRHLHSHLFFAHVRAATGTAVTRQNCHPFACGRWMFMHNGFIGGWSRLRRRVEGLIGDDLYPSRIGTTDSEALFLALMSRGLATEPVRAMQSVIETLHGFLAEPSRPDPMRVTAALANGEDLYAFRLAANDTANTLYFRASETGVVVVSEPLDNDQSQWQAVPDNHVLIAEKGKPVQLQPLATPYAQAAE
jgi:predicted glutamine amidotransferase